MVADCFGFLNVESKTLKDVGRYLKTGIEIGNHPYSLIGDPELGQSASNIIFYTDSLLELIFEVFSA